jgi:prolyl-tRNA editing enzyme YbaK/EbsC (Cys-tRNA(Pro) deacylase)
MAQSIEEYLNRMGISYKAHLADGSTVTAQDAAAQLGVPLKMIIKTIVFVDDFSYIS